MCIVLTSLVTSNSLTGTTVPLYKEGGASSVFGTGVGMVAGFVALPARPLVARFVAFVAGG